MLQRLPRTIASDDDSRIETLSDGFERLGPEDTPFTLRGGEEKHERAEAIHQQRSPDERVNDERSNESITRNVSGWEQDLSGLDFPLVDTIPHDMQLDRAQQVATAAREHGLVGEIQYEVPFDKQDVYGKFWAGESMIEIAPNREFFPGYAPGPALAHEVSHSVYAEWTPDAGFDDGQQALRTHTQREQAEMLSKRLYGPFAAVDEPFVDYRRGDDELFAAAFTSRVIEPEAARRHAPQAVDRIEEITASTGPDLLE